MNIPFKSKLSRIKDIDKRNAAFEKLSPEDQRKEIAYDALKLVIEKKVKASYGEYWSYHLNQIDCKLPKTFQNKLLNKLPKGCQVCQRGLMMLSQIRLSNTLHPRIYNVDRGTSDIIKGFTILNFSVMECEFEHSEYSHPYGHNTEEKLANICCNVLANDNFNKRDKKDYLTLWKIKI